MSDSDCFESASEYEYYSTDSEDDIRASDSNYKYYSTDSYNVLRTRYRPPAAQSRIVKKQKIDTCMVGVYVLEDCNGRVYVGKSNNISRRICEHKSGNGTSFLDKRSITQIMNLTDGSAQDLESWERSETLAQMHRKGINNVRGWMFTTATLSDSQQEDAFKQVCEKFDLCRKCGHNNHFAVNCFARKKAFWVTRV